MPFIKKICERCDKEYEGYIFPSRISKYCSRNCYSKYFDKGPFYSTCLTCKKDFCKKRKNIKFCSVKCFPGNINLGLLSKARTGKGFWQTATEEEKWERVKSKYNDLVIKKDGCWDWNIRLGKNLYGVIHMGKNKSILAHRASWIIHNGPILNNLWILHTCDNPRCTNPDHLYLGTPSNNTADCLIRNRRKIKKGIEHHYAKLNEQSVKEIRLLTNMGYSQNKLGKKFNVSPSTIQGIVDGKTWKHV